MNIQSFSNFTAPNRVEAKNMFFCGNGGLGHLHVKQLRALDSDHVD